MKKWYLIIFLGSVILAAACKKSNNTLPIVSESQTTTDSAAMKNQSEPIANSSEMSSHESTKGKVIVINDSTLEDWHKAHITPTSLDKTFYKINQFARLKEGQTQFDYYLLQEPIFSQKFKSAIIYEFFESERAVWLVNYSSDNTVIDAVEVFYDNAEGAWLNTSKIDIDARKIELTEIDMYATPEETVKQISILPDGKFLKIDK